MGWTPGLVIECLNGYRLKKPPSNLLEFTVPLGIPEVIRNRRPSFPYGSVLRVIGDAVSMLAQQNQLRSDRCTDATAFFDINHRILVLKTNRIVFVDEDVPGGASAYMFNKVLEELGRLPSGCGRPTISGKAHRPAYGSDGEDYFSKPNADEIGSRYPANDGGIISPQLIRLLIFQTAPVPPAGSRRFAKIFT